MLPVPMAKDAPHLDFITSSPWSIPWAVWRVALLKRWKLSQKPLPTIQSVTIRCMVIHEGLTTCKFYVY